MAVDRATQAVQAMDKFVVFVVLMVLSNHMVLYANAIHPRTRLLFLQPIAAANTNSVLYVEDGAGKATKPQLLAQQAAAPPDSPTNFKLQFVDSIFQIPIATLKAVNELVQTITKNFATTGTLTGSGGSPAKASIVLDSAAQSTSPVAVTGKESTKTSIRSATTASTPVAGTTTTTVTAPTTKANNKAVTSAPQTMGVTQ